MADVTRRSSSNQSLLQSVVSACGGPVKVSSFIGIWMFGLYLMIYATSPVQVTLEMENRFAQKLTEAQHIPGYNEALDALDKAQFRLYDSKVWFWRFRSGYREKVYHFQDLERQANERFQLLEAKRVDTMREAKYSVGLWSDYGIEEARSTFWSYFESGKSFAKRQTMWDMIFSVAMGRDETFTAFLVRVVLNIVINFTLGLIGATIAFAWSLWSLLIAYKASFLSGLLFFIVAMLAVLSMVFLYIFLIYGTLIGGAIFVAKTMENQMLQQGQQRRRQNLHNE